VSIIQAALRVFSYPRMWFVFLLSLVLTTGVLLLILQWSFLTDLYRGDITPVFYIQLLPDIVISVIQHISTALLFLYAINIVLFSIYLTFFYYIFIYKKFFSISTLSTNVASIFGISLGISCISCGAIAGTILVSIFGSTASSVLLFQSGIFLAIGELLLILSIILSLITIRKFERLR